MKNIQSTGLYATADLGNKVSEYAYTHSTALPKFIVDYHATASKHESAAMLSSNFQSQLQLLLAQSIGAKKVLEIGLFLGYSAMVWSHAVGPGGLVTGLEFDPEFAKIAEDAFAANGVNNVEIMVGPAAESLTKLTNQGPYDLVFIDADKDGYSGYLKQLLAASQPDSQQRLLRPGALIIADNVLRQGCVADDSMAHEPQWGAKERFSKQVAALKIFNQVVLEEPRLHSAMLPLWDGVTVMRLID